MDTVLEINNLKKRIGKKEILNNIDLNLKKGVTYGLVGPNGSGKSSLLKCIANISKYKGAIYRTCDIGYSIEEPSFYKYFSAFDNLYYLANLRESTNKEDIQAILRYFEINYGKLKYKSFSYGMKVKLSIASAFLNNPGIVILDEPTNGLDPVAIKDLRRILASFKDKTIIISSHLLSEVEKMCDEVIFIKDGRIIDKLDVSDDIHLEEKFFERIGE